MQLRIKLYDLILAFSNALDQVHPALPGHHMRVGFLLDRLSERLGLSAGERVFTAPFPPCGPPFDGPDRRRRRRRKEKPGFFCGFALFFVALFLSVTKTKHLMQLKITPNTGGGNPST